MLKYINSQSIITIQSLEERKEPGDSSSTKLVDLLEFSTPFN